jgi:hypothetical protein
MEEELGQIESGDKTAGSSGDFYNPFSEAVTKAMDQKENLGIPPGGTREKCPKCGKDLVKWGETDVHRMRISGASKP